MGSFFMRSFHFTRKCRFLQSFRADFFCARSCAALASIWAPSNGGTGRRLNAPVSRFAAQKALPRTVACRDSSTAHTPASAKVYRRTGRRQPEPLRRGQFCPAQPQCRNRSA